jgi:periplasmic divalent cation tolerance protein
VSDCVQVTTATDSREAAEEISRVVVDARLAACAQIVGPVASRYWWQGRVDPAEEWLVIVKTTAERFEDVAAAIRSAHSYEVPEISAVPIVAGSPDYLAWIQAEATGKWPG